MCGPMTAEVIDNELLGDLNTINVHDVLNIVQCMLVLLEM